MDNPKPEKTLADYVGIAISPALIMVLVGSLAFFLLEVIQVSPHSTALKWTMFWYVIAIVLITRIGIEQGKTVAMGYGVAIGLVTSLVILKYASVHFFGSVVIMGLIWWCAHKLTWDCTLIDDSDDASGEGLLQVAGIEQTDEPSEIQTSEIQPPPQKKQFTASDAAALSLEEQLRADREHRREILRDENASRRKKSKPHAPGLWIIYFSLAALPLFGLGQILIPATQASRRSAAFQYLWLYVAAALALLLTTSFLGLRRYLRQRHMEMPSLVVKNWLTMGGVMILVIMVVAFLLPRPKAAYSITGMIDGLSKKVQKASDYAFLKDDAGKSGNKKNGKGRSKKNQKQKSKSSSKNSREKQTKKAKGGNKKNSQKSDPKSRQKNNQKKNNQQNKNQKQNGNQKKQQREKSKKAQSKKAQGENKQDRNKQGKQSQQKQGKKSEGGQKKDKNQKGENKQPQSKKKSDQQQKNEQNKQQKDQNKTDENEADKNEADKKQQNKDEQAQKEQKADENRGDDPKKENEKEEEKEDDEDEQKPNKDEQEQQPEDEESEQSQSQPWNFKFADWIGAIFKWILYFIIALVVLYYLIKNWEQVVAFFRQLWQELMNLFNRKPPEKEDRKEEETVFVEPPPPFASFRDPFLTGSADGMRPSQVVVYTFDAMESWAYENADARQKDETPLEFAERLESRSPSVAWNKFAKLYTRTVYSEKKPNEQCYDLLRNVWHEMSVRQSTHSNTMDVS